MLFKYIGGLILLLTLLHYSAFNTFAQTATCDACGYCANEENKKPKESWGKCVACLYDVNVTSSEAANAVTGNASTIDTLALAPDTLKPLGTKAGYYYTSFFGCIKTTKDAGASSKDSTQVYAAGILSQKIFNLLFNIVKILAIVGFLWGAYSISTSSGDVLKLERGRKILMSSLAGLLLSVFAVFIIDLIIKSFFSGIIN
jgi:hypothetical protein